ncbi:MAG: MDR-like protein ABC transporter [uncultured bacterium (gcode 4)]|uniref:MDR-like protein ABC transporter n=1 Tax=uncultured bacterium (gcode 4) TaxID=1234023 RepID=K2FZT0_9BACT|nr:MAG: MDR-like protein ABC transporter [uncultured bacterium (gcode 4)]
MIIEFYSKLKILLSPLRYIKKNLSLNLVWELYDWFQSIYLVQVLAYLVAAIQAKDLDSFYFWIFIFIIVEAFAYFFTFVATTYFVKSFYSMWHTLHTIYLRKFINLDNNKIDMLWTWRSFSIISKWVDSWIEIVLAKWINVLTWILSIIYAFWIIAFTVWFSYLLIILAIFFLLFLIIVYWNSLSLKYRRVRKEITTEYDRSLFKIISSKFEILQNNRIENENKKLLGFLKTIVWLSVKEEIFTSSWNVAVRFIFAIIQLIIFFWLWLWVIRWEISFSYFILVNWLIGVINKYVWWFSREIRSIWVQMVNVDKLLETFDYIDEIKWINNPTPFNYCKWNICIRNLNFWYSSQNIFTDFSADIRWNAKTALVWDSWSGKTTLMKLVAWYINPTAWEIIVDEQNVWDINLISYYKNIWYLTQDPSVFDGTIMENLTYALDREPTQKEIDETIRNSKCEFISELPNGMDTEIGERWIKLSGGQKQRLAIAKIMLKNPNIILLDEPTSALDSISEQVVSEALHNLFRWRTVLVIAHRLQTVKEADDIIVLKKWQIIERWTHSELSQIENWEYKKMLDLQTSF